MLTPHQFDDRETVLRLKIPKFCLGKLADHKYAQAFIPVLLKI